MGKFILDTNILIMYPQILGYEEKIIIPQTTVNELRGISYRNENIKKIFDILVKKLKNNKIELIGIIEQPFNIMPPKELSINDQILIYIVEQYKVSNPGTDVYLITNDNMITKMCILKKIKCLNLNQLKSKINDYKINAIAKEQAEKINKAIKIRIIKALFIGILSTVAGAYIGKYIDVILPYINVWGTMILIQALGIGLYYVRHHLRVWYGYSAKSILARF